MSEEHRILNKHLSEGVRIGMGMVWAAWHRTSPTLYLAD
jgi:hypothetical protein